jgi:hypothetical protein
MIKNRVLIVGSKLVWKKLGENNSRKKIGFSENREVGVQTVLY